MLCTLSRWLMSRAEDTGRKLPRSVERHLRRCGACKEYARSAASLSSRLRAERSAWLAGVPDFPPLSGFEAEPSTAAPRTVEAASEGRPRRRPVSRLLPVASAALAVVAALIVLSQVVHIKSVPSAQDRAAAMAAIKTLSSAPEGLQGVIGEAESSLDQERRILEQSLTSAVEYLQARLNIKIERRDAAKRL